MAATNLDKNDEARYDASDARYWLEHKLEETADFRQRKAKDYPDDERNADAASLAHRLRNELSEIPDSDDRLKQIAILEKDENRLAYAAEDLDGFFSRLGFTSFPDGINTLLADYIQILKSA